MEIPLKAIVDETSKCGGKSSFEGHDRQPLGPVRVDANQGGLRR